LLVIQPAHPSRHNFVNGLLGRTVDNGSASSTGGRSIALIGRTIENICP